jgi:hypothetical protein
MKQNLIATGILATVVTAALSSFAADSLPKPQAFARYEPMMNRSPFAVATAPAPMPAATPNFAKDLYIANAARTADGDLVTIASTTDKNFKKYLSTKTTVDGYSVPNIEWSDRVGATTVTISKDGQFATLTFNQALLSQPATNVPQMQPQIQPQVQSQMAVPQQPNAQVQQITPQTSMAPQQFQAPNGVKQAPAMPNLPTPPPRVRGTIPRNPSQVPVPQATPTQPQGQQPLISDE